MNRITQLKELIKEDPSDPFLPYALALEYAKTDLQKAVNTFAQLLEEHPSYLPAYYHYADAAVALGKTDLAESLYKKGMDLAEKQGDMKTYHELDAAHDALLDQLDG